MFEVLQVGRVVGEHWRLRKRLGEGGAGRFWEAEDLRARGRVAIEFAQAVVSSPEARTRIEREGRAWLSFRCAHVARVLDHGFTSEGCAFRVTEWLGGEELARTLERVPVFGVIETAEIVDQVCRAIAKLEAQGLASPVPTAKSVFLTAGAQGSCVVKLLPAGLQVRESRATVAALGRLAHRMLTGAGAIGASASLDAQRPDAAGAQSELQPFDEWFRTALHADATVGFSSFEQASLAFGHIARAQAARSADSRSALFYAADANAADADPSSEEDPDETDISGDAVLIEPGVFATGVPGANDARARRTRWQISALLAITLGAFGGFMLRTALSDVLRAGRTPAPLPAGVAASGRANREPSPALAANAPVHDSTLANTHVDSDVKSQESQAAKPVHARWQSAKQRALAAEPEARAFEQDRASVVPGAAPAVASPASAAPPAPAARSVPMEPAPTRVYRGF